MSERRTRRLLSWYQRRSPRQFLIGFAFIAALILASMPPINAQPSFASALLQAVTTRIILKNATTGKEGLCHGYVDAVRAGLAYIVTAAHCVDEMTLASFPADPGKDRMLGDLSNTIYYPDGSEGKWCRSFRNNPGSDDAYVVVATAPAGVHSWRDECSGCAVYTESALAQSSIPVMSILSAGGGAAVVSSGLISSTGNGDYILVLPAAAGTSGALVVDFQGNIVGIVSAGRVAEGTEAGWNVRIVAGRILSDLVDFGLRADQHPERFCPAQ